MAVVQDGVKTTIWIVRALTTGVVKVQAYVVDRRAYLDCAQEPLSDKHWAYTREEAVAKIADRVGGMIVRAADKLAELRKLDPETLVPANESIRGSRT